MPATSEEQSVTESAGQRARGTQPVAWLAFAWGFLEATVFFIVPDVLLTALGMGRVRTALAAALAATAGAMLGGIVMYEAGQHAPEAARTILRSVPGINPGLIADVRAELDAHGPLVMARGLVRGWPYKVYAVESGATSAGLVPFLVISAFARTLRFVASVLLAACSTTAMTANFVKHCIDRLLSRRAG